MWLHKCTADHAAVHRAPLVGALLNTIFDVVCNLESELAEPCRDACGCSDLWLLQLLCRPAAAYASLSAH